MKINEFVTKKNVSKINQFFQKYNKTRRTTINVSKYLVVVVFLCDELFVFTFQFCMFGNCYYYCKK